MTGETQAHRAESRKEAAAHTAPHVSVVVPTHNRSRLLSVTLRSILGQRQVQCDVIVVDDGSTDDTREVIARFNSSCITVVHHDRSLGVSAARNRGISETTGEWVAFCDDDDLWAPDKLAAQIAAARAARTEWAYAGAVFIDSDQRVHGGTPPLPPSTLTPLLARWDPIPGGCSNVIVSKRALVQEGSFSPELDTLADWDLWLRLAAAFGPPACVSRPLVGYRQHTGNMSLDIRRTLAELDRLEARHGIHVDRPRFDRYLAGLCLRSGRKREAIRLLIRAAAQDRAEDRFARAAADLRMLWRFGVNGASRRLGYPAIWWQKRRHIRARAKDPHLAWKLEAQRWLESLQEAHSAPRLAALRDMA